MHGAPHEQCVLLSFADGRHDSRLNTFYGGTGPCTWSECMRRREFITFIGGAATWPLPAWAEQSRSFRIGYLAFVAGTDSTIIMQRLQELGYRQGENLEFVYRSADG